jgi:hypothetical protein
MESNSCWNGPLAAATAVAAAGDSLQGECNRQTTAMRWLGLLPMLRLLLLLLVVVKLVGGNE